MAAHSPFYGLDEAGTIEVFVSHIAFKHPHFSWDHIYTLVQTHQITRQQFQWLCAYNSI